MGDPSESIRQYLFLEKMHRKCQADLEAVAANTEHNSQALQTQQNKCDQLEKRMQSTRKKSGLRNQAWQELYQKEVLNKKP